MNYKTFLFDCDGVILDSNSIKSQAFYKSVKIYGKDLAIKFKKYHIKNGGVSRFEKFNHFINVILNSNQNKPKINELLNNYSDIIYDELIKCKITPDLKKIKNITKNKKWAMVSGSKESELRKILKKRKIDSFFDSGIFGSPKNKFEIFEREIKNKNIKFPAVFFGDTKYDYEVAKSFNIDFVFVSAWTEFTSHQTFFTNKGIRSVCLVKDYFRI
tara:strand:+ start:510 stop:1154 length:645 start_codon:yes stop_codon:yes gene_type:complete